MTDQATELFSGNTESEGTDKYQSILQGIVNEEGTQKFADVETALNSITAKDQHITTLEAETAQLRAELEKRQSVEDALKKAQEHKEPTSSPVELDVDTIADVVNKQLEASRIAETVKTNQTKVTSKLIDLWGENAEKTYIAKAGEIGLTTADLDALAGKSPDALFELLGVNDKSVQTNKTSSTLKSDIIDNVERKEPVRKSVMGVSTSEDLLANWRSCAPSTD